MRASDFLHALILTIAVSGCSHPAAKTAADTADTDAARSAIKAKMIDPGSAGFLNERVRVLWSDAGDRLKVYCADVKEANPYGGKTGYHAWYVILDERNISYPDQRNPKLKGFASGPADTNPDHYLLCNRADTQRSPKDIFTLIPGSTTEASETPAQLDKMVPEISYKTARF